MNKKRRRALEEAEALISQAREIIETARDEEQEAYDNLPEGLQAGEAGEAMDGNRQCLDDALDALDEICDTHLAGAKGDA